ncbi:MAG: hypothetical protein JWR19_756 [Pedosphaera sp.]|nr:hypothetical protein [Pedosphaera sp.]
MKILLQQTGTALYFKTLESWTSNSNQAFDFRYAQRARNFIREQHLSDVNVVMVLREGLPDNIVPLPFQISPPPRQSQI